MRHRTLIRKLQKHPYILDANVAMSLSDAQIAIKAYELPSFAQIVEAVKQRSDLPQEAWRPVDRIVEKRMHPSARAKLHTPLVRRWAIAAATAIVIAALSLTPSVRAWAAEVWHIIVNVFDGHILIDYSGDLGVTVGGADDTLPPHAPKAEQPSESSNSQAVYADIQAFISATGKTPFTLSTQEVRLTEVYSEEDPIELLLSTSYETKDGVVICLSQVWIRSDHYVAASDSYAEWNECQTAEGFTLYYIVDETTNTVDAMLVSDECLLTIGTDAYIDAEWLASILTSELG